jgi:outer membrane biosynthesis protein TonB
MFRGLAVSTLVHASVLAMAMLSWPQPESQCDKAIDKLRRETPGIRSIEIVMQLPECATSADLPIDFEDVGLVSNVSELRKVPEPVDEALPPPEPEVEEAPAEAPPEPAAEPEEAEAVPDPRAKPQEVKKPEPKKPEPKKTEALIKKEPPKKKENDLAFLDDFDKALQDKRQARPRAAAQATPDRPAIGNADRDREGAGDRSGNTASLQASVRRQIGFCWRGIEDLPKEDQIDVMIRMQLATDGSLIGSAELVSPKSRPAGRSGLAVDLALRAVRKCAPYNLPEDAYEQWKDIEVTIGPIQE